MHPPNTIPFRPYSSIPMTQESRHRQKKIEGDILTQFEKLTPPHQKGTITITSHGVEYDVTLTKMPGRPKNKALLYKKKEDSNDFGKYIELTNTFNDGDPSDSSHQTSKLSAPRQHFLCEVPPKPGISTIIRETFKKFHQANIQNSDSDCCKCPPKICPTENELENFAIEIDNSIYEGTVAK